MDVSNLSGKLAVVTGAGSGIGRATALALAKRGADLAICDVNEDALEAAAGEARAMGREVLTRRVDVSSRDEMKDFAAAVHERVPAVDIVVNNAGVALGASFLDTSMEDWDWILGINLVGVIHGCHFFIPPMVEAGRAGHVVNVSSSAGYVAGPPLLAYSTTKFGVLGMSEALSVEMRPHGIGVTVVCPGIINTGIVEAARMRGDQASQEVRNRSMQVFQRRNYGPERVAEKILLAIQKNRVVAPVAPEAWAMYFVKRFSPRLLGVLSRTLTERFGGAAPNVKN